MRFVTSMTTQNTRTSRDEGIDPHPHISNSHRLCGRTPKSSVPTRLLSRLHHPCRQRRKPFWIVQWLSSMNPIKNATNKGSILFEKHPSHKNSFIKRSKTQAFAIAKLLQCCDWSRSKGTQKSLVKLDKLGSLFQFCRKL